MIMALIPSSIRDITLYRYNSTPKQYDDIIVLPYKSPLCEIYIQCPIIDENKSNDMIEYDRKIALMGNIIDKVSISFSLYIVTFDKHCIYPALVDNVTNVRNILKYIHTICFLFNVVLSLSVTDIYESIRLVSIYIKIN